MASVLKHVYHYCAVQESMCRRTVIDGIAYCQNPVIDIDGYRELKESIMRTGAGPVSITSMSYLGQHQVSGDGPDKSVQESKT